MEPTQTPGSVRGDQFTEVFHTKTRRVTLSSPPSPGSPHPHRDRDRGRKFLKVGQCDKRREVSKGKSPWTIVFQGTERSQNVSLRWLRNNKNGEGMDRNEMSINRKWIETIFSQWWVGRRKIECFDTSTLTTRQSELVVEIREEGKRRRSTQIKKKKIRRWQ